MKEFAVLIIGVTLTSPYALTGTPDQDPVVKMLREKFESAKVPTVQELQIGRTWVCKGYNVEKDDFRNYGPMELLRFSTFDGIIQNKLDTTITTDFVFNSDGFVGRAKEGPGLIPL